MEVTGSALISCWPFASHHFSTKSLTNRKPAVFECKFFFSSSVKIIKNCENTSHRREMNVNDAYIVHRGKGPIKELENSQT